jgi:hypothetical protein
MTRNQKIALGCGGAGCLGLIVVVVAGCLLWFFYYRAQRERYDRYANINFNSNRNFNLNSNENENTDETANTSSASDSDSSSSAGEYSEDEKHKLFQAAALTADLELQRRVWVKIGIMEEDYTTGQKYADFIDAHGPWSLQNYEWVAAMNSPEKGRTYVNEHLR